MPRLTQEQTLEWALCQKDAHCFVFGNWEMGVSYLTTKDEHRTEAPEQPFPDLPYLRTLLDTLLVSGRFLPPELARYALDWGLPLDHLQAMYDSGLVFLEKSRQVMATWTVIAYLLWRAKFHPHQLILVQSKKEEDAAALVFNKEPQVARMSFLESRLPAYLRSVNFATSLGHQRGSAGQKCHIFFPNGSHVWAIPQGGHIIRSNTSSCLFSDEAAFQPEFGMAYTAALPAIKGGGQGVFVSSAELGDFQQLVEADV
jgi:hypothetical protein